MADEPKTLTDTGGPFSEAKLIDVFAAHAIAGMAKETTFTAKDAEWAYEVASLMVAEKRRREA